MVCLKMSISQKPTECVNSMVAAVRKDKIRICIDPKVKKRELYHMFTIEEIVSAMPGATIFSILDEKSSLPANKVR